MKDKFFQGRRWPDFESFKADLDVYVAHWDTRRRRVKLKGLTPAEFRSQPPLRRSSYLTRPARLYS